MFYGNQKINIILYLMYLVPIQGNLEYVEHTRMTYNLLHCINIQIVLNPT